MYKCFLGFLLSNIYLLLYENHMANLMILQFELRFSYYCVKFGKGQPLNDIKAHVTLEIDKYKIIHQTIDTPLCGKTLLIDKTSLILS